MSAPAQLSPLARRTGPNVGLIVGVIGVAVLALASFYVIYVLDGAIGDSALVASSGLMALFPLAFVIWAVLAIDRWEPEPRIALWFAALWGGIGAVILTLWLNENVLEPLVVPFLQSQEQYEFYATVIQAPFTEELWKAIPIVIMFLFFRKTFDGPVDGIVLAALSAAGFAFTENILYFGSELVTSGGVGESVIGIFVMRGLMSPFAHVMFTLCTGLAIGIAARRRGVWPGVLAFFIGLIPAMMLHALWNGATFVVGDSFFLYYAVVQMPLFAGAIVLVGVLRRRESRLTFARLSEYAAAGWFNPDELPALATPRGRRQAVSWARGHGIAAVMNGYIKDATRLAFIRQRLISGHDVVGGQVDEAAVLASIVARRAVLQPQIVSAQAPRS